MTKTQLVEAITKADIEIKKQQATLLKAQARLANAEAAEIEKRTASRE